MSIYEQYRNYSDLRKFGFNHTVSYKHMDKIKILDTDKFFTDSPNTGDADCLCSRCGEQIKDGELILRVAIDQEILYTKNKNGDDMPVLTDMANGTEFRLCKSCIINL